MEKLTLTPQSREIIVNNGSLEGAIDLFSYGPESEESARTLGSLYVVGHRDTDSSNLGYMVSLIAAMARREYYAQLTTTPRDAFARTLRKMNEVVEEFFKSSGVNLSVGIFAIAGGTILVSKLEKFRILLAREGEVIDILNNVILFSKEHVEKRQFSSIISGSVQSGDRLLAYYPSKAITSRERYIKGYMLKLNADELASRMADIGKTHSSFATALLHVDMVQTAQVATVPGAQPKELQEPEVVQTPTKESPKVALAWAPRQHSAVLATAQTPEPQTVDTETEVPHIISTEFSMGTRRSSMNRWIERLRVVRLDTRGKAIFLTASVVIIVVGALMAKSFLFVNPEQQKAQKAITEVKGNFETAKTKISNNEGRLAREILTSALAVLAEYNTPDYKEAEDLAASIVKAMDTLDNAQDATLSLVVQLDPKVDRLVAVTFSSSSQSIWAVSTAPDSSTSAIQLTNGQISARVALSDTQPTAIVGFKTGALAIEPASKKITRILDGTTKTFILPTQETIQTSFIYDDNLFVLTDASILKVTDLDTNKPVTKQWLLNASDLAPTAGRLYVDGSVWTLGKDGGLTNYYKGKKATSVATPLEPTGNWELVPSVQTDEFAMASTDTKRIYIFDTKTGQLVRTLKLDTQQDLVQMTAGADGSVLVVTRDNKIWSAR